MIIVRLTGRMGNQLFQYAFALSEQKRLGTYAVIDDRFQPDIVTNYFSVHGLFQHKLIKRLVFRFNKLPIIYQDGAEDPADFFERQVGNSRYYYAYFQSETYFKTIKEQVKGRFRIQERFQRQFHEKYGNLFRDKKVLAIHYRFGDYLEWGKEELGGIDLTLPDSYYRNAAALIAELDQYLIVVVTDDIQLCESRTSYLKNKMIVSDSEIMDFQILLNADTLITANSSFSWWAAYLNKKNARVYAPEYWLGFKVKSEFPNGIIPDHYIKVPF